MNQEVIKTLTDFIPEDIMSTNTVKNLLKTGNINEALSDAMKGKTLKERRSIAGNLNSIRKAVDLSEKVGKKHVILINSSRIIKRQIIQNMSIYIPETSMIEKLFSQVKRNENFSKDELELLSLEEDENNIYVIYDGNNRTINRKASKILGFPVGGNVIFYNKNRDLEIHDVVK